MEHLHSLFQYIQVMLHFLFLFTVIKTDSYISDKILVLVCSIMFLILKLEIFAFTLWVLNIVWDIYNIIFVWTIILMLYRKKNGCTNSN